MKDLVYARSFVLVYTNGFKPMELYTMTDVKYKQRVQDELNELVERKDKLAVFLTKDKPSDIDIEQWSLLHRQLHIMVKYIDTLEQRLALM